MTLSSLMCTQALGVCTMPAARAGPDAIDTPINKPPAETALEALMKERRETVRACVMVVSWRSGLGAAHLGGCGLDRGAHPDIGAAAADVARHRLIDIRITRVLVARQQRGRAHQLAALTVAALRHVVGDPRLLQRMAVVAR